MTYDVTLDDKAIDFLSKLPKEIRKRIIDKLESTIYNPFHFFERLKGRKDYKLRVGDYRVIADIEENKIIVTIIGHRKSIYKRI